MKRVRPPVPPRRSSARPPRSKVRTIHLLDEALTCITAGRPRSLLTALGTFLGVAGVVATLGLTWTVSAQIDARFDARTPTKVTLHPARPGVDGDRDPGVETPAFPSRAQQRVRRLDGVRHAGVFWRRSEDVPVSRASGQESHRPGQTSLPLLAATPGMVRAAGADLVAGRLYDRGHGQRRDQVAILGLAAAERLGVRRLGQQTALVVDGRTFRVIGIVDDAERYPGLQQSIAVPLGTASEVWPDLRPPRSMLISTELGAAERIGALAPLAVHPEDPDRLVAEVPPEPRWLRRHVEGDVTGLLPLLAGVSVVTGAGGIVIVTLLAVRVRVREIGLRRALGARKRHVGAQIIAEGGLLGAAGGLAGMCVALATVVAVSDARGWTPVMDPRLLYAGPPAGMLTGMVAGAVPAFLASRLPPVKALGR